MPQRHSSPLMTDFIDVRHPQAHTSYINTGFIVARQPQTHKFCTCSDFRCQPHREVDASLPLSLYEIESRVSMEKDGTENMTLSYRTRHG